MPTPALSKFAKQAGVSMKKAEELWDKAKKIAAKAGHKDDYAYITGILKKSLKVENAIAGGGIEVLENGFSVFTFMDTEGSLKFSTTEGWLLEPKSGNLVESYEEMIEFLSEVYESSAHDSDAVDLLEDYEGPLELLYLAITQGDPELVEFVRTAQRPKKRRFSKLGPAFNPITGKRKDPHLRRQARKIARKGRAKRKRAARKFAISAKGKSFHRKLGKLVARIRRH